MAGRRGARGWAPTAKDEGERDDGNRLAGTSSTASGPPSPCAGKARDGRRALREAPLRRGRIVVAEWRAAEEPVAGPLRGGGEAGRGKVRVAERSGDRSLRGDSRPVDSLRHPACVRRAATPSPRGEGLAGRASLGPYKRDGHLIRHPPCGDLIHRKRSPFPVRGKAFAPEDEISLS